MDPNALPRKRGRTAAKIDLPPSERIDLDRLRSGLTELLPRLKSSTEQLRVRGKLAAIKVILLCADGWSNLEIASRLRLGQTHVSRLRNRFARDRMKAFDTRKPVVPLRTSPEAQAFVIKAFRDLSEDGHRPSDREVGRAAGVSGKVVARILKAHNLRRRESR